MKVGEDDAWGDFIRTFSRFVPIVSAPLGLTAQEREDVLQEMMLTAFRSIQNVREPSGLASWAYTIARRTAIAHLKARRRHRIVDPPDATDLERHPSQEIPVDEMLAGWEEAALVRQVVATLKPRCRSLIEDLFLADPRLSYKEVSAKHGMAMGSIGPTLARCLEVLRSAWIAVSRPARSPSARVQVR